MFQNGLLIIKQQTIPIFCLREMLICRKRNKNVCYNIKSFSFCWALNNYQTKNIAEQTYLHQKQKIGFWTAAQCYKTLYNCSFYNIIIVGTIFTLVLQLICNTAVGLQF